MTIEPSPTIVLGDADDALIQALAYRGSALRHGRLVVQWATLALSKGFGGATLAMLAGTDADDEFEVERLLNQTLAKRGQTRPPPVQAVRMYVCVLLRIGFVQTIGARAVAIELCQLYEASGFDEGLVPFVYLCDDLDRLTVGEQALFYPNLTESAIEEVVRSAVETARDWFHCGLIGVESRDWDRQ